MRADSYAFFAESGNGDSTCGNYACRDASRKMTSAAEILKTVILNFRRIIGMTRARFISEFAVILAACILIFNYKSNRRTGSFSVKNAADNLNGVGFLTSGRDRADGFSERHLTFDKFFIDGDSWGDTVKNSSYRAAVTFAENGKRNACTKCIFQFFQLQTTFCSHLGKTVQSRQACFVWCCI